MSHDDITWAEDSVPLYTLIGGRTRPDYNELDVETLVRATPGFNRTTLEPEQAHILALCPTWRAVAEISAGLKVPLLITKIQLSDLIARRAITLTDHVTSSLTSIHHPEARRERDAHRDPEVLRAVIAGLRKLA